MTGRAAAPPEGQETPHVEPILIEQAVHGAKGARGPSMSAGSSACRGRRWRPVVAKLGKCRGLLNVLNATRSLRKYTLSRDAVDMQPEVV